MIEGTPFYHGHNVFGLLKTVILQAFETQKMGILLSPHPSRKSCLHALSCYKRGQKGVPPLRVCLGKMTDILKITKKG